MNKIVIVLLLLITQFGFAQDWKTNFDATKKTAMAENKAIVLVFSGSDWCAPCIKLHKNIWQSDAFKEFATTTVIIEKADFPKKKQNQLSPEIAKQNQELAQTYNPEGIFPLVVVMDKSGKVLGKASYQNIPPNEYIALLQSFIK
ncbi:thiol-disulfide isomerase [Flavobacterium faecale]|uniref:Thiol-disulfide isomerase n=1 Tax=Flavobacterium faecale TaxID=1355330 RepID=A0A2S1LFY0_9FLAO|nr:thioredoxin family protein [Flavobacterium faecale]AWG22446.1 thiol-disulfide isomerase [Flavobacterium faecale]